jgi:3-keto-L-gulonate-6-phosphate decarboxylase
MKQTAVEWLEELIECGADLEQIKKCLPKAKEMEKEQIIDAYDEGDNNGADRIYYHSDRDNKSAEQYYNETFKSE